MIDLEKIKSDTNLDEKSKAFAISLLTQVNEMHEKAQKGLVKDADLEAKMAEVKETIKGIDVKSVQEQVDNLTKQLHEIKTLTVSDETKSLAVEMKEKLNKEIELLKKMKSANGNVGGVSMELKSFLETANASITTGSLLPTPQFEMGISKAPDRTPSLLSTIATGIANSQSVYWTQRKTRTDNQNWVTEGTTTTLGGGVVAESVLGYETKSANMQNLLAYIKVSNNSIDDIDWLLSEIQSELFTLMALKLDADILSGTVALNGFDGILTKATAFNAAGKTLPAGVVPNRYDALKFAATQIKKANHNPNYVRLNPDDILLMELDRDDNGGYLFPPYLSVQPQFAGIRIVEDNGVPSGTYVIGDFSKAKFWMRKGMELQIHNQNEADAINMLKTITLYMRGTLVIKDADVTAFVKDTFADTITEITLV